MEKAKSYSGGSQEWNHSTEV